MSGAAVACALIFAVVYALIATERVHKTKAALAGAALVLLVGLVDQETAFYDHTGVDWNTIFLLIGMMIIVNITRRTGVFEWLAIRAAKLVRGHPIGLLALLSVITAVLSALLDNVTTVLLIAPVTILVCQALETDPVPYLVSIVLASNIGGTATLVGHPPNIMIGSAARFTFVDFLRVDAPIAGIALAVFIGLAALFLRRRVKVTPEQRARLMEFDESKAITDWPLLRRCLMVLGLTIVGFVVHGWLHLEPATIALAGAALLLLLDAEGPEQALREVEWPTLFFFIGLFIMVGGLVKTGIIGGIGHWLLDVSGGSVPLLSIGILWLSGVMCGFIDHIPYAAAMIPLVKDLAISMHPAAATTDLYVVLKDPAVQPLWWALSLGANLGANATIIAAATNVVVAGIAERAGYPISFKRFLKYGVPVTVINLALCSLYLWLRFFLHR